MPQARQRRRRSRRARRDLDTSWAARADLSGIEDECRAAPMAAPTNDAATKSDMVSFGDVVSSLRWEETASEARVQIFGTECPPSTTQSF